MSRRAVAVLLSALLLVSGCWGDDDDSGSDAPEGTASSDLRFTGAEFECVELLDQDTCELVQVRFPCASCTTDFRTTLPVAEAGSIDVDDLLLDFGQSNADDLFSDMSDVRFNVVIDPLLEQQLDAARYTSMFDEAIDAATNINGFRCKKVWKVPVCYVR